MRFIPVIIMSSVCLLAVAGPQAKPGQNAKEITATPSAAVTAPQAVMLHSAAASADEQQALRDDLKKMRALLRQMETNLAFVDASQTPLKHQFQLEIEMWRTLIDQMERRLPPAGEKPPNR